MKPYTIPKLDMEIVQAFLLSMGWQPMTGGMDYFHPILKQRRMGNEALELALHDATIILNKVFER